MLYNRLFNVQTDLRFEIGNFSFLKTIIEQVMIAIFSDAADERCIVVN